MSCCALCDDGDEPGSGTKEIHINPEGVRFISAMQAVAILREPIFAMELGLMLDGASGGECSLGTHVCTFESTWDKKNWRASECEMLVRSKPWRRERLSGERIDLRYSTSAFRMEFTLNSRIIEEMHFSSLRSLSVVNDQNVKGTEFFRPLTIDVKVPFNGPIYWYGTAFAATCGLSLPSLEELIWIDVVEVSDIETINTGRTVMISGYFPPDDFDPYCRKDRCFFLPLEAGERRTAKVLPPTIVAKFSCVKNFGRFVDSELRFVKCGYAVVYDCKTVADERVLQESMASEAAGEMYRAVRRIDRHSTEGKLAETVCAWLGRMPQCMFVSAQYEPQEPPSSLDWNEEILVRPLGVMSLNPGHSFVDMICTCVRQR